MVEASDIETRLAQIHEARFEAERQRIVQMSHRYRDQHPLPAGRHQRDLPEIHRKWCEMHPERAGEERALRKQAHEITTKFGRVTYGTPETRARAAKVRQGALARLHGTGAITIHQLGAALEIAAAYERICLSAGIPTSWAIERVDGGGRADHQDFEAIGAVWSEYAYSRWRRALPAAGLVLAIIVEDIGIEAAARRFATGRRRARRLLTEALDLWAAQHRAARNEVTPASLAEAHAAIL